MTILAPLALALVQATPSTDDDARRLVFDWPRSGSVVVHAQTDANRTSMQLAYRLVWQPAAADELVFRIEDFEVVGLDGLGQAPPERVAATIDRMEAMQHLLPAWRVNADGRYAGAEVFDQDALSRAYAKLQKSLGGLDAEALAASVESLRTPEMRARILEARSIDWTSWVGQWTGFAYPEPGKALTGTSTIEVNGLEFEAEWELGIVEELLHRGRRCVRLGLLQVVTPEAWDRALDAWYAARGQDRPDGLVPGERRVELTAIVEPDTLRPHEVHRVLHQRTSEAGRRVDRLEGRHFAFDWPDLEPREFKAVIRLEEPPGGPAPRSEDESNGRDGSFQELE